MDTKKIKIDTKSLVKLIAEYCSERGQNESRLLWPDPQHYIYTFSLFDFMSDTTGIPKEQIVEWFNNEQEEIEKKEEQSWTKRK